MVSFACTVLALAAGRLTLPKEPEKQLDALYKKITHSAAGMQVLKDKQAKGKLPANAAALIAESPVEGDAATLEQDIEALKEKLGEADAEYVHSKPNEEPVHEASEAPKDAEAGSDTDYVHHTAGEND